MNWQIVGKDLKLFSILPNQKNDFNSCSSDERRNWFYGCLSSMDSNYTEVESSLDLKVLLSKMRNNLTFGMDTQIDNFILYPYFYNRLTMTTCLLVIRHTFITICYQ